MKTGYSFLPSTIILNVAIVVKAAADTAPMDLKRRVSISWSGGKDSAFALYKTLQSGTCQVVSLHTVIGKDNSRVGLHGICEELIEQQARSLGLPLEKIYLDAAQDHIAYEQCMQQYYTAAANSVDAIVFGDIYLEDLKRYRQQLLEVSGLGAVFPLWQVHPKELIGEFLNAGFRTAICACNDELYRLNAAGTVLSHEFVNQLPPSIDPCGERGEFHTFVFDGPIFNYPIDYSLGATLSKEYQYNRLNDAGLPEKLTTVFWFQDFLPLMAS